MSSYRSRAKPLDCLKAAESKLSKYQFYTLLHSRKVLSREIPCVLPVGPTGHRLWYVLIIIIWRAKDIFIAFVTAIMFRIENITLLFKDIIKLSQSALTVFGESQSPTGIWQSLETLEMDWLTISCQLFWLHLPPHSSNLKKC